jgi:hypothetical protein
MLERTTVGASANLGGDSFLGESLLDDLFLGPKEDQEEKPKLWGNYRGSRYLILKDEGACMTLAKELGGEELYVSSCNVSDISSSPTTQEKICPGNNQCRRNGLRQGPKCKPIRPEEGNLHYPHPI